MELRPIRFASNRFRRAEYVSRRNGGEQSRLGELLLQLRIGARRFTLIIRRETDGRLVD